MADTTGTYTSTYDSIDRTQTVINPAAKNITHAYDAVGNRASMGRTGSRQSKQDDLRLSLRNGT